MTLSSVLAQNLGFLGSVAIVLLWAKQRLGRAAPFPGPRPVGPAFKTWLIVIWLIGLALPLAALIYDGFLQSEGRALLAITPYLVMFIGQVVVEIVCWKRLNSPIWVLVPTLFLPWRLFQIYQGLSLIGGPETFPLTYWTLIALFILWTINIGVHFSNIPRHMRWDVHPLDAKFDHLSQPNVFAEPKEPTS